MSKVDEQDRRIETILGDVEQLDFEDAVGVFFDHVKKMLQLPCEVRGIEDFRWEEYYVLGPGEQREYERLKKTQPSYRDRYELLAVERGIISDWMLFAGEDIAAQVRRKSDGKAFCLGLSELGAVDRRSSNYQLMDDYAVWFVNYR